MIPQYFVPVVQIWYLEICSRQYWQSLWKSDPSIQTSVRTIIAESNLNNLFNFILSSLMVKERMFNVQTLIAESFCLNGTVLIVLVLFGSGCCSWVDGSIELFGWGFIISLKSLSVFRHSPLHCGNLFHSSSVETENWVKLTSNWQKDSKTMPLEANQSFKPFRSRAC